MNDTLPTLYEPRTFTELCHLAEYVAKSDLVPKDFRDKPANCMIAIQMGREVGLSWANALQSIAVINGRPSIWGDAALALVMSHPHFEGIDENESDSTKGVCVVRRKPNMERRYEFTLEDARAAGLLGRETYKQHQARMLQMRARARAVRDLFPDALKGLSIREDAQIIDVTHERVAEEKPAVVRRGIEAVKERLAAKRKEEPNPKLKAVLEAYTKATTPAELGAVDRMAIETLDLIDKTAASVARQKRIAELRANVDKETGEIKG